MRHARIERSKDPNPGSVSTAFGLALLPESTYLPYTVSSCLVTRSHSFSGAQGAHRFRNRYQIISNPLVCEQRLDLTSTSSSATHRAPTTGAPSCVSEYIHSRITHKRAPTCVPARERERGYTRYIQPLYIESDRERTRSSRKRESSHTRTSTSTSARVNQ